jgi:hypothetical protein
MYEKQECPLISQDDELALKIRGKICWRCSPSLEYKQIQRNPCRFKCANDGETKFMNKTVYDF